MDHPARIYVDETYGDDNSFLIQAAIALPAGNVETAFTEALDAKIAENPKFSRSEFKGGSLSEKNRDVFQWFLQQTINILAEISDHTPVRTIIAIDSMAKYKSDIYDKLYDTLKGSLADIGYPATEIDDARDFIRQLIWLHARLTSMFPPKGAGGIEIFFDKKYRLDQKFEDDVSAWVPRGPVKKVLFREKRWKAYTRLLRNLLRVLPTTRTFPEISKFTYIDSKANFLIQAADLLTNLMLNAIRHRMGITNDLIQMKYQMLCSVMDADPIEAELLKALTVTGGKVHCADPDLFSKITLSS